MANRRFWPQGREYVWGILLLGIIGATWYCSFQYCQWALEDSVPTVTAANNPQFNLEERSIPVDEIFHGGPPKDGIPSLVNPGFVAAEAADFMRPDDQVIGVDLGGEARAYPIRILQWHEIVNDQVGDDEFAVVYCPLCDSSSVFDRRVDGEVLEFGVSGLLYRSNVLMYDRQETWAEESLWSQMMGEAVAGPKVGTRLANLPFEVVTWAAWQEAHGDAKVLDIETGYDRDYSRLVYADYFAEPGVRMPIGEVDERLELKEWVLGVMTEDSARVYPIERIPRGVRIEDSFEGHLVGIARDEEGQLSVDLPDELSRMYSFWFSWRQFHSETDVYHCEQLADEPLSFAQAQSAVEDAAYVSDTQSNCLLSPSSSEVEGE